MSAKSNIEVMTTGTEDWNGHGPLYYATAYNEDGDVLAMESAISRSAARSAVRRSAVRVLRERAQMDDEIRAAAAEILAADYAE